MLPAPYARILSAEGFRQIAGLHHRLELTAWWNAAPDKLIQVIVLTIGQRALIRGDKTYFLRSVAPSGDEFWVRDLASLHNYLETHFAEFRVSFAHFRDVPAGLADAEVRRRMAVETPTQRIPTVEEIALIQHQVQSKQQDVRSREAMTALLNGDSDLLSGFLHAENRTNNAEIDRLQRQLDQQQQRLGAFQHLQREYQRKGSAAAFAFTIVSNMQVAEDPEGFRDALREVVKELSDAHRYQVMQKLCGGRLRIHTADAKEPLITWIEQWLGGALTPMQLQKLGPEFNALRKACEERFMVTPDSPIFVNEHVRHAEKHLGARFLSDVMQRLDATDNTSQKTLLSPDTLKPDEMPLTVGYRVDETGKLLEPVALPLTQMTHLYTSGATGSGKSFLARVLIEEAAQHKQLSVLVLDPRNQSVGLLLPEDRPKILDRYEEFGMKIDRARGYAFQYFAPGLPYASPLPNNLSTLSEARSVVSFKGLDDQQRCVLAGTILNAVFEACNAQESDHPRLLILVDEAQLFTRKRLDESAKQAAARVERALDRIAREGRKFGIVLALVSQTMKDFGHELVSIRQMTTTKIFLRNSDREVEFAADFIGDGRALIQLPTGTALAHSASWGVVRVRVRAPYSKVFELGEAELRQLVGRDRKPAKVLSAEARRLLDIIKQHAAGNANPLIMSRAADLAAITSKRKFLTLIGELEYAGTIRTKLLPGRGSPRIIEIVGLTQGISRSQLLDGAGKAQISP